ncbi:MAG TPA: integrase core domain-containing protein [Candidatus Paceibacterota bacterium]|nr:integrase core domain-containing protein [Candidatus Paceibacterota bacterium]
MSYSTNPSLPKIRQRAAELVAKGWSARKVGRYLGFHHTAVMKWVRASKRIGYHPIPTKSSRPKKHPRQLSDETVWKIFHKRLKIKRCAEVVHEELKNDGVNVSLSSVKRTLDRSRLLKKRSPWKRYHPHVDRPYPLKPGDLVQTDTIHLMISKKKRIYVFALLDVYSRWAYAKAYEKMNAATSIRFVKEAQRQVSFCFNMLQSDHGPEFGKWFVSRIQKRHRYTRIGKPNDNAHIERFNRTLQEECLDHQERRVSVLNKALKQYLPYYNEKRLHLGINLKTPEEMVSRY